MTKTYAYGYFCRGCGQVAYYTNTMPTPGEPAMRADFYDVNGNEPTGEVATCPHCATLMLPDTKHVRPVAPPSHVKIKAS